MDIVDPFRFALAFLFILSLIGLMGFGLKRFRQFQAQAAGGDTMRLRVIETRYLDPKRRLVIVCKDDMEYLLLLADDRELVIESRRKGAMMPEEHRQEQPVAPT